MQTYNIQKENSLGLVGSILLILVAMMVLTSPVKGAESNSPEYNFWLEAKSINDTEAYKMYIRQYPSGTFERLAKYKIKKLEEQKSLSSKKYLKPNGKNTGTQVQVAPEWFLRYPSVAQDCAVGLATLTSRGVEKQYQRAYKRALSNGNFEGSELTVDRYVNSKKRLYVRLCKRDY